MYRYLVLSILFLGIGTPFTALAAIEISEVAWMGSVASPNHEWIELVNSGPSAVVVDDWTLVDGNSLLITLTGTIPSGAYVVLERTSEDSAPGAAFLVYTGALVNSGATLTLRQSDGQIADQVVGGSDWAAIGGDNATKATAQQVGSVWRTGTPTPGGANSVAADDNAGGGQQPVSTSSNSTTGTPVTLKRTTGGSGETIPLRQASTELKLAMVVPAVVYERQSVKMHVVPSGIGRTITESLNYQWNFGDFTTATGSAVTHRFTHPGTYLVTVHASFGRHDVVTRQSITVLPVTLSVTRTDEAVLLNNDAVYDIDVSGFRLVAGGEAMTLPPHSYVAAKQSVRLPISDKSPLIVRDERGAVVVRETSALPVLATTEAAQTLPLVVATFERTGSINTPPRSDAKAMLVPAVVASSVDEAQVVSTVTTTEQASSPAPSTSPPRWPYALLGLLLIGAAAAVAWPRTESSPFMSSPGYNTDES